MSLRIELPSTILWSSAAVLLEPQSDSGEVHEFLLQSFPTLLPIAVTSRVCTFRHNGILRSMTRVPSRVRVTNLCRMVDLVEILTSPCLCNRCRLLVRVMVSINNRSESPPIETGCDLAVLTRIAS